MHDNPEPGQRDWRIPDALWAPIQPLLPARKPHPLGCHRSRVDDRRAMDAIFFVRRTGCQWNALNATGLCSSSAAHRRFQEWAAAGVFLALWQHGLAEYDALQGIDWQWLAIDGARTKAPLGGENGGEVRELLTEFGFTAHIRARGEEAQALKQDAGYKA